jgi:hypothetical protein
MKKVGNYNKAKKAKTFPSGSFPKVKGGMTTQGTQSVPAIQNRAKFLKKMSMPSAKDMASAEVK